MANHTSSEALRYALETPWTFEQWSETWLLFMTGLSAPS